MLFSQISPRNRSVDAIIRAGWQMLPASYCNSPLIKPNKTLSPQQRHPSPPDTVLTPPHPKVRAVRGEGWKIRASNRTGCTVACAPPT
jgi:hypothetical protein